MFIDEVSRVLSEKTHLKSCVCNSLNCCYKGKIIWDITDGDFVHLQFDQCVMKDEPQKRCDCIIFFQSINGKNVVFIVEFKERWYSLTEVQDKITTCYMKMLNEINFLQRKKIIIIPLLYASRHISGAKRTFAKYPIKIRGKSKSIVYLKNGENITKALKM